MPDKKISQLNTATTLDNVDLLVVVNESQTKKTTLDDLKTFVTSDSALIGTLAAGDVPYYDGALVQASGIVVDITGNTIDIGTNAAAPLTITIGTSADTLNVDAELILGADATDVLGAVTLQQLQNWQTGLWDDRGNFTPSGSYPSTGGSSTGGAILKGDTWTISGLGSGNTAMVGSKTVNDGDVLRALVNTPGTTDANWAIQEGNLGYTPITNALSSGKMLIGNSSNIASGAEMSGDATMTNTGVVTVSKIGDKAVNLGGAFITDGVGDLTFTITGDSNVAVPVAGTLAITGDPLSQFASTTSAQLAGVISDDTGTGALVFASGPTLVNPIVGTQTAGDNSTKAASTAYANALVADAVNNGTTTIAPSQNAVYDALALLATQYRLLRQCGGKYSALATGTYWLHAQQNSAVASGSSSTLPPNILQFASADYPTLLGLTPKLKIRAFIGTNDTAPGASVTFTLGLHPVTRPATSGGAAATAYTAGTVVSGSTGTVTGPAVDSIVSFSGHADFTIPSDGVYALAVVISGANMAANSSIDIFADIQIHYT